MYKNQLQELAQRSCFNLPSYSCIREGPDHAPRFKATVNFNGELFESPAFFSTLRQAEHAAAEVALSTVAKSGPSKRLAAQVLDERGVYKNLLQETAHRAGLNLPVYATVRSGTGNVPVFSCTVELAGMTFTGQPAKTKKQAQKNAAMAAWSSLKQMSQNGSSSSSSSSSASSSHEDQDKAIVARFLSSLNPADPQNNLQKKAAHQHNNNNNKSATISRNSFPSTTTPFSPRFSNYPSSSLSPDMAFHYMWMQEQALPLGIPHNHQLFPWHPNFHPSHLPFAPPHSPFRPPTTKIVTIQEIKEDKTDEKNGQARVDILSPSRPTQRSYRMPGRMQQVGGGSQAPFMVQPVQIRSVVPVFSAAPRRVTTTNNPSQESPTSDISIVNSKMGNLHV